MTPYYEQDGITIYHGDCRDVVNATLVYNVVLSDPPYGTGQKVAYDVFRDTLVNWQELADWLVEITAPMAFTLSHSRLFDLKRRPQGVGVWDKMYTAGIVHVGASPCWEPICFYNLPAGDRGRGRWDDVFRYVGRAYRTPDEALPHPCPKPVALYRRLVQVLPEGVVLDPFMGSGTTLLAAKDLGRRAIGIDVSEAYCELAARRLSQGVLFGVDAA